MRVLLVSSHGADLSLGGAERYVADLARGLARRGHDVEVLSAFPVARDGGGARTATLHRTDWRSDPWRRIRNHAGDVVARPGRALERALAAARPELVHTSNLPGISTAVWEAARLRGTPVVHTLHDFYLLCPRVTLTRRDGSPCRPHPLLCGFRTRRLGRWAGAVREVIAGSEHLLAAHAELFPRARSHVVRLPLAPVTERLLRPPGERLSTLAYLGALEREKGVEALLGAAPGLAELGVSVRIAGNGRLRAAVEAAEGPGLRYAGVVLGEEKLAFIEAADAAVLPSLWAEPSGPPYALLEWLAAGRPALVSTRGGLGEARGMPGVLAIEPTPEGIVDGVRRLLDGAWDEARGKVRQVTDAEDVERWLDEHEAIYERAAG